MLAPLKKVLHPAVLLKYREKKLTFCEDDTDTRLKEIQFAVPKRLRAEGGGVADAVVISGEHRDEKFQKFSHFLDDRCPDVNRKCDYIVFHQKNECLRVILVEMKSSEKGLEGRCPAQFEMSKIFCDYLLAVTKAYEQFNVQQVNSTDLTIEFYKVVFYPALPVAHSLPVGVNPLQISKKISGDGIISLQVVCAERVGKAHWEHFMDAI